MEVLSCQEDVGREGAQAVPPRGFFAIAADALLLGTQKLLTPWARGSVAR